MVRIEAIKDYVEEKDISIEEVDLGEYTIEEIKLDHQKLSKYFLLYYNSFKSALAFFNGDDRYKTMIKLYDVHAHNLRVLRRFLTDEVHYGKEYSLQKLIEYVDKNYDDLTYMIKFIRDCFDIE